MAIVNVDLSDTSTLIPKTEPEKEMLSVGEENGRTLVRINSSSLSIIQECPRKAKLKLFERWTPEHEGPPTIFGKAMHKAMETYYSMPKENRKLPKLETLELMTYGHHVDDELNNPLLKSARSFIDAGAPLSALPPEDKRSLQNGVWILWNYFKDFIDDQYVTYTDASGPFVERDFTFRLFQNSELIIDYFGRIDLALVSPDGNVVIVDHKTTSVVGSEFYSRLKPNHQYTGYLLGGKELGLKTNSFLVNALEVKSKPKTPRGKGPNFPRQITTRDEADYQEFKESVVESVYRYLAGVRHNSWPLGHVNACAMYSGCGYLSVCSAPQSMRETILKSKFKKGAGV